MTGYNIIAAVSDNLAIGKDNSIPWHITEDLQLFKRLTLNNIVVMGRLTFESIGKPLPGRTTIVISRSPAEFLEKHSHHNLFASASLNEALEKAQELKQTGTAEVFIAGGASIYRQAIAGADRLYISRVPGEYDADTFFPELDSGWKIESTEAFKDFTLEIWSRK